MRQAWLHLKRLVGINPSTPLPEQEGQVRYVRDGAVTGKLYVARRLSGGTHEWTQIANYTDDATFAGSVTAASFNSPVWATESFSVSSPDASTTDTVNYATACTLSVTLPAGTWTVSAIGGMRAKHSAGGSVRMALEIDGTEGTARSVNTSSTSYEEIIDNGSVSGISGGGSINVILKYRSTDAGTSSSNNPWIWAVARRTS